MRSGSNLIKVGSTYLNLDLVAEIRDTGVDLEVFFIATSKATSFRGQDAELLRHLLDQRCTDLNAFEDRS